jgi:hypothetical protein
MHGNWTIINRFFFFQNVIIFFFFGASILIIDTLEIGVHVVIVHKRSLLARSNRTAHVNHVKEHDAARQRTYHGERKPNFPKRSMLTLEQHQICFAVHVLYLQHGHGGGTVQRAELTLYLATKSSEYHQLG